MSISADRGAPGRPATFTGQSGLSDAAAGVAKGEAKAFGNMGAKEGGPSAMPSSARSGAFECDESCRGYNGDPRKAT